MKMKQAGLAQRRANVNQRVKDKLSAKLTRRGFYFIKRIILYRICM